MTWITAVYDLNPQIVEGSHYFIFGNDYKMRFPKMAGLEMVLLQVNKAE